MTYYGAKDLRAAFETVRRNTLTIAEEIPEEKYSFRATPETRSVGEMLAHVAVAPMWQVDAHQRHVAHIDFATFGEQIAKNQAIEKSLSTKDAIVKALRENGDRLAEFLGGLDEATLQETVSFPPPVAPPTKTRFEMVLGIKEHEMHHRAQLMTIERLLGIVPHLTRAREAFRAQTSAGGAR